MIPKNYPSRDSILTGALWQQQWATSARVARACVPTARARSAHTLTGLPAAVLIVLFVGMNASRVVRALPCLQVRGALACARVLCALRLVRVLAA